MFGVILHPSASFMSVTVTVTVILTDAKQICLKKEQVFLCTAICIVDNILIIVDMLHSGIL